MVKHKQLDKDTGSFQVITKEQKYEFFCFRCSYRKTHKVQVVWNTQEGKKIICNACYEQLMAKKKRPRLLRKKRKVQEEPEKPKEEDEDILCPYLLDLQDNNSLIPQSFTECVKSHLNKKNHKHYYQQLESFMNTIGFTFESELPKESINLDELYELFCALKDKKSCFTAKQFKLIFKATKKLESERSTNAQK